MVQFHPFKDHRSRRSREYPSLPLATRIHNWAKRVHEKSKHLPRPLTMQIRMKYAVALGWQNNWVQIDADGNLLKDAAPVTLSVEQ